MTNPITRRAFIATTLTVAAVAQTGVALAQSTEHAVEIKSFAFQPADIKVKVGDTITFTNADRAPHTATSKSGTWGTKRLNRRKSETMTVTKDFAGEYFCKFHPNMKGSMTIVG
ncbi:MAG: cupredoxin domain-containing protein [Paracoccaceae bacterium]|nr:cupredoxin domain-containing protein [Paracoccaceae bacterium]